MRFFFKRKKKEKRYTFEELIKEGIITLEDLYEDKKLIKMARLAYIGSMACKRNIKLEADEKEVVCFSEKFNDDVVMIKCTESCYLLFLVNEETKFKFSLDNYTDIYNVLCDESYGKELKKFFELMINDYKMIMHY